MFRINELEREYEQKINNYHFESKTNSQRFSCQAEQDQATIENLNITIKSLETIIKDLKWKVNCTETLYNQENKLVKALTVHLEEVISTNKEVL